MDAQALEARSVGRSSWVLRVSRLDGWTGVALLAVAVALFCPLVIIGDGVAYYTYVQRLFGDAHHAVGWYPGLALVNAPFYAVGKLLAALGVSSIDGKPTTVALVALAGNVFMLVSAAIGVKLLQTLRYGGRTFVVVASVLGTSYLFFGLFMPSGTHAAETMLATAATGVLLWAFRRGGVERWQFTVGVGVLLGLATATRYSLAAMIAGLIVALALYRRFVTGFLVGAVSVATFLLAYLPARLTGSSLFANGGVAFTLGWTPTAPLHMLFGDARGIFVWTPVTLLAVIGFVRMLLRRHQDREFLVQVGLMQIGLVSFFFFSPMWKVGWSFSSRYLSAMFPLVVLGLAEWLTWRPRVSYVLATLATLWSLYLCLNITAGIDVIKGNERPGHLTTATDIAQWPAKKHTTWKEYLYAIYYSSHLSGR